MNNLLETMVPIFGLMVLGFASARTKVIGEEGVRGLVLFVFNFSIPALLLRSLGQMEFPADIEWGFLIAFYGASFVCYGLGFAIARFGFGHDLAEQAIFGMGAAFSNVVLMGIPIVLTALGPEAALPMFLIIGFHSALFMPLTVALIQGGRGGGASPSRQAGRLLLEMLKNPIILGIFAGIALNASGMTPWVGIDRILELLGSAAVPCALFAMGASLASYPLAGHMEPALAITFVKLVIHPVLVWIFAGPILGLDGLWVDVAVVMASMPSAVNVYLFAARYHAAPEVAARTVLVASVGSLATIAITLILVAS